MRLKLARNRPQPIRYLLHQRGFNAEPDNSRTVSGDAWSGRAMRDPNGGFAIDTLVKKSW
jgi:hypothetical protein